MPSQSCAHEREDTARKRSGWNGRESFSAIGEHKNTTQPPNLSRIIRGEETHKYRHKNTEREIKLYKQFLSSLWICLVAQWKASGFHHFKEGVRTTSWDIQQKPRNLPLNYILELLASALALTWVWEMIEEGLLALKSSKVAWNDRRTIFEVRRECWKRWKSQNRRSVQRFLPVLCFCNNTSERNCWQRSSKVFQPVRE